MAQLFLVPIINGPIYIAFLGLINIFSWFVYRNLLFTFRENILNHLCYTTFHSAKVVIEEHIA
uniref:Uncharacterized protein n=1 Tax=Anguilla anguilla TaxID=7936 RepID=A0A0E9VK14_ANGAN